MNSWLSSTWEANWRPFQYFNFYRLIVGGLALLASWWPSAWTSLLHVRDSTWLISATMLYLLVVLLGTMASWLWQHRFNLQLSLQIVADIVIVTLFTYSAGGVASGIGVLLLISLAAASLVGRGRLVLFYAALSTLAVLAQQLLLLESGSAELSYIVQAGILSAGFFATAILARLLGQRIMANEEVARRQAVALKNQELISSRIIETMQDGVLVVSADAVIRQFNPEAEGMLDGLVEKDGLLLAECSPALARGMVAWSRNRVRSVLDFKGREGRPLRARFEATASSDAEVVILIEDIGRIQERAQQLKLASLGRLTASIAHEIRNPLSSIGHAAELLREEKRLEIQERLLRIVGDNVGRLDRIVQDVLDLGHSDRVVSERIALGEFCRQLEDNFVLSQPDAAGVLKMVCPPAASIQFDRAHLHQVLFNLLVNALRHSQRQPGSVRLGVSLAEEGWTELHVLDDGSGVPDSARDQVFEPFFTTHHQGTGLGLFIARELSVANGGQLELGPAGGGGHFIVRGRSGI